MPIVTLDSIRNKKPPSSSSGGPPPRGGLAESSSEDEEDGNEYFTGGTGPQGQGSGLAVLAPGGKKKKTEGGTENDPFKNMVDRLIREQAAGTPPPPSATAQSSDKRMVTVTAYRDGFSVDGGPLRRLDDAKNKDFMESLVLGYCPAELLKDGKPVDVRLENKMEEDFTRSGGAVAGPNFQAFNGVGASVGEISQTAGSVIVAGTQGNGAMLVVDQTAPGLVRVQLKFPDGKREVAKFEKQHTVRHLIARVEQLRPNLARFQMLSGDRGPPKPVDEIMYDETLTVAGLAGALIIVKEV